MSSTRVVETYRGVVHPWLCDAMGHMNVRHYIGMFDDAAFQLLGMIGGSAAAMQAEGLGWADVRHVVAYEHEVGVGALVLVRSDVIRVGRTSVSARHEMLEVLEGTRLATLDAVTVLFDLRARKAAPLPDALRARAKAMQGSGA
jgi:acyl-CoA thioester hydrolase